MQCIQARAAAEVKQSASGGNAKPYKIDERSARQRVVRVSGQMHIVLRGQFIVDGGVLFEAGHHFRIALSRSRIAYGTLTLPRSPVPRAISGFADPCKSVTTGNS